eukprot:4374663-Prymnesium_polylepis.1
MAAADEAALAARAEWRRQVAEVQQSTSKVVGHLEKEYRESQRRTDIRLAACWDGVRESRVELGDVMHTVHHLIA